MDKRTLAVSKNIGYSVVLKAIGLLSSLLIVPMTLTYLQQEQYGIWLTLSSILYWISFMDVGLGNGMRNYLTQAISNGDYVMGRKYFATTIAIMTLIVATIAIIVFAIIPWINFSSLFNTASVSSSLLRKVFIIAMVFTMFSFVMKNIGYIYVAHQKYAINDLLIVLSNVLALAMIYLLTKTTEGNLTYVVIAFTLTPLVVYLIAIFPTFHRYPALLPTWKDIDRKLTGMLVGKGLGFFFIQITSCLVIFGASNLLIAQYYGPKAVTTYNIAYKFFNLLAIGYTIIISPLWNAYTDAAAKSDYHWIKVTFLRSLKIWALTVIGGVIMLLLCNIFYALWVGKNITIPLFTSASVLIYISMYNLNNCATYLLNGLNTIRVQIITSILITAIYLLSIYLFGNKWGLEGIILSMATSYAIMSVIHLYQCRLLMNKRATGIWNK
ncbi:MAG: hypothetical protein Q4A15_01975 [Prevotellaceae bacterium]|nr:hypothetical protein [Prevotellaceae bacterium]